MRVGKSYKQHALSDKWDAIVIGSGVGGLSCAGMLARHLSKRVLVLERHYTAGGYTHTFKRPGYEWDVGVHYIGEVHRPHSLMRRAFDHLTGGELAWADMGKIYDTIVIAGDRYEFPSGQSTFVESMKSYFPHQTGAIDRYIQRINAASKHSRNFFAQKALPNIAAMFIGPLLSWSAMRDARRTLAEVFQEVGIEPGSRLAGVLSGQYGDYGLPPKQASFLMHAILVKHYMNGGAYPVGGSSQIAKTMAAPIEAMGGAVVTSAEVDSVLFAKNRAQGVRMADGRNFFAPLVISDAGWALTWSKLVPEEQANRVGLFSQIPGVGPSLSHAALYVGAKKDPATLGLKASNIWVYPHEDHDSTVQAYLKDPKAALPLAYLSFPAAKDPSFQARFPGRSTIEVIGFAPWERFSPYAKSAWKRRDADYEASKQELAERLIEALYAECPSLRGCVEHMELSTPLTTQHFMAHPHGEIYGLSHVPARFLYRRLRPETPFHGFYLTGSDICTAGVGGALMGGIIAASAIAKRNLVAAIVA